MHAAFQYADPQDQADDQVRPELDHAQAVHGNQGDQAGARARQGGAGQVAGIEHGDHDDRAQVIDDGQGHQEQFQRHRHALAEQRQDAQCEGDIGGHGDRPAGKRRRVILVDCPVDQCRHDHAADRCGAWQDDLRRLGQVAVEQLALDLQADQQKEQGHQAIVDPQQRGLGDLQRANLRYHGHVEERAVEVRQR